MKRIVVILLGSLYGMVGIGAQEAMTPTDLQCEHLVNPLGIDATHPRFSWKLQSSRQGVTQHSYRIIVGTDSLAVAQGKGNSWDSGIVESDCTLSHYQGNKLLPFTRYFWKVQVEEQPDTLQTSSKIQAFETGMMKVDNWQGAWITDRQSKEHHPAPYFRKVFHSGKPVKVARAYIAVGGLYELFLNGEKVGNHRLDPMFTRYDRRILYVTYDVTSHIRKGKNAIGVILGNGWYNHQALGVWGFADAPWRNRPTFCLDLRLTYDDNTTEVVSTGLDWRTSGGSIIRNNIYTGENQDANKAQPGWNSANFDDSQWNNVNLCSAPSQHIVAQQLYPIRNVETIPAQYMNKLNDSLYVFDLGRNIAGVTQLKIEGKAGTIVRLIHAERLSPNGRVDLGRISNFHRPTDEEDLFQTDTYILSGKGKDTFMPKFNYKGFRYVEVSCSEPTELKKECLTGYFMHNDVPEVGNVTTSDPIINKIWKATNVSYLSNLFGYPTDCPQREKNGWTGDGHLGIEAGLYNYDALTIYEKWLADHRDEQQPNGVLPDIIPTSGWGYGTENGLDWTSTIALIPWNVYLFYGDSKLLEDCYENIKRYVDYVDRNSPQYLSDWGRGDWVPVKTLSSKELTSSVYYYVDTNILAHAAKLFGKQDDYEKYTALAENIKEAINKKYLNRDTGIYAGGSQTELSVPLMWGVVPEDMKAKVAANLANKVQKDGCHVDVGVLGCKALLNALSENGYADLAFQVAAQKDYPSWGWWISNGATALVENWDYQGAGEFSDNHMMFGEIGTWFYKALGGIKPDSEHPGFRHILLAPHFVKGLNYANISYQSPSGLIVSNWKRKGKKIIYEVTIPANCTATFTMPANIKDSRTVALEPGTHVFELQTTAK
ncbi:alpha-L-rhamnosidase [Bacteroides sp. OM05-10AA]|uniref:alpha-L-rhamnosidase n=1 Tax=Bacteroides sp. OM05-10AA TaxID=2292282 RepID=UPI000E877BB5|nr:alpha-L-rhamnosidase [Bacteroides sp. OM05-10AA]RGN63666.1 alpha-rhamnosidase [Bacteroides sp. OM05-10AA]